ncbi:hypothetical protein ACNFIA_13220 [Pseudomonas sp. NY15437]|uniref:hypothetical protein n=1 Tax=Pseudomonas sp. NY15437 TaxID=3400360 RepID=UPI003A8BB86A
MKKIAIFVEGQTELELTCRLILEIAGRRGVTLEIKDQHRGSLRFIEMRGNIQAGQAPEIYVLLVNCNTDNQVKSQIRDQHASLTANGYTKIIGLRDVLNRPGFPRHFPSSGNSVSQTPLAIAA